MFRACLLVERGAAREDRPIVAAMALGGTHELEVAVLVFVVVPASEAQHPPPCFIEARKGAGELGPVLAGAEQALRVGVVVRDALS